MLLKLNQSLQHQKFFFYAIQLPELPKHIIFLYLLVMLHIISNLFQYHLISLQLLYFFKLVYKVRQPLVFDYFIVINLRIVKVILPLKVIHVYLIIPLQYSNCLIKQRNQLLLLFYRLFHNSPQHSSTNRLIQIFQLILKIIYHCLQELI